MKLLILSQVFWPDTASTAQHLYDFAVEMQQAGHRVTVICSRFAYENPKEQPYTRYQRIGNDLIEIKRLRNTRFGKDFVLGRLFDFLSFNILLLFHLFKIRQHRVDAVLGMTSPPLISFIGVRFAKFKKIPFIYWTMDLQPELSIASGLIKKGSISAYVLTRLGAHIIKHSSLLITLDKYMGDYLLQKGAKKDNIAIIPVWPVLDDRYIGVHEENPYRVKHGLRGKIVIMFSGNHAYVHPLDTLLEAAKQLRNDNRFVFVFIGGGVRKKDVSQFKAMHQLENIIQLPFEPRENIHNSLGASDLQVVVLGKGQVGFTHPNKIYGAMFIGKPILYIGPPESHVIDILINHNLEGNIIVEHHQTEKLTDELLKFANLPRNEIDLIGLRNYEFAVKNFSQHILKDKMKNAVLSVCNQKEVFPK